MSDTINLGKNTIYFTPSNEQLLQIAKDHPEFHQQIKDAALEELKNSALKATRHKLQSHANSMYEKLYAEVEKRNFEIGNYWKDKPSKFSEKLAANFTSQIEEKIHAELENELAQYLVSPSFQNTLKSKIREKILSIVLQSLDEQIQLEAKKLIA